MGRRFAIACAAALPLAACSDGTAPRVPARLEPVSAEAQVAVAGTAVPVPPAVRVLDDAGQPIAGTEVSFEVEAGGGQVEGATPVTDADGVARAGAWVLGITAGPNLLRAVVDGVEPVTFQALAEPGAAASIEPVTSTALAGVVGEALSDAIVVRARDAHGNPVPGVAVAFVVIGGAGTIDHAEALTDEAGLASAGAWRLGQTAGEQRVRASAGPLEPVEFVATAAAGPPAAIEPVSATLQHGRVAEPVDEPPAVRVLDAYDNPVAGEPVTFRATEGGGTVAGATTGPTATVVSGADGVAAATEWLLGTVAGEHRLHAELGGGGGVTFIAVAAPGPPAEIDVVGGEGQEGTAGEPLPVPIAARVEDAYGNRVPAVLVTFNPTGGGTAEPPVAETDAEGVASTTWRLGAQPGEQRLEVRAEQVVVASISATATPAGDDGGGDGGGGDDGGGDDDDTEPDPAPGYDIMIRFVNEVSASQAAVFAEAAARWSQVIVEDVPDLAMVAPLGNCPGFNEHVDDLIVFVRVQAMDGPGSVLASAGPCHVRAESGMTISGMMVFDEADMPALESTGRLLDVAIHEIGHILGFGIRWTQPPLWEAFLADPDGDPHFTGPAARAAFDDAGGWIHTGPPVPVEDQGGSGTRLSHWRESVFGAEVMTGWINAGFNPLSAITIAALRDMGYGVTLDVADPFTVGAAAPPGAAATPALELRELPLPLPPIPIPGGG